MAHQVNRRHHHLKVLEKCGVSPPPSSVPSTSLPLTSLDIPLVVCVPVQIIFFYEFPHSTDHFLQRVLPSLKHSVSLTLQHFFPFAGNFVFPPQPHTPSILYSQSQGDSLSFTVTESTQDFHHLIANTPKDVKDLHPLVPVLPSPHTSQDGTRLFPIMAIQVTVLPNSGFSICVTFRHVAADGSAFMHFMKFWSYICRTTKGDLASLEGSLPLPLHNRDTIEDPKGIKLIHLQLLWNLSSESMEFSQLVHGALNGNDKVRVTCVLKRDHVEKLKKWVVVRCKSYGLESEPLRISTFVVTCSLIWVCMVKSEVANVNILPKNDEIYNWSFLADCRNHPELSIPSTYFGNCLVGRFVSLKRSKQVGENGIVEAVLAIEDRVRDSHREPLKGFERLLSDYVGLVQSGQHIVSIAGSTRLGVYDIDFGWGKPKKWEVPHIEYSGSISLCECRDNDGGAEVGVVLERIQMNNFNTILEEHLRNISEPSKL